jgi:hypothetical protein
MPSTLPSTTSVPSSSNTKNVTPAPHLDPTVKLEHDQAVQAIEEVPVHPTVVAVVVVVVQVHHHLAVLLQVKHLDRKHNKSSSLIPSLAQVSHICFHSLDGEG